MSMKNVSMGGKLVITGFLVVFLMAIFYQPAFAAPEEAVVSKNRLKLTLGVGITAMKEKFIERHVHKNIWVSIQFPIPWWPEFGLEVGYNAFQWNLGMKELNEKFYWWNVNPTMRLTFGKTNVKPFVSAGPGIYIPKHGKARLGFKGGLGLDFQLSDQFMIEIGGDYHYIFLTGGNVWGKSTDFIHSHVGLVISL